MQFVIPCEEWRDANILKWRWWVENHRNKLKVQTSPAIRCELPVQACKLSPSPGRRTRTCVRTGSRPPCDERTVLGTVSEKDDDAWWNPCDFGGAVGGPWHGSRGPAWNELREPVKPALKGSLVDVGMPWSFPSPRASGWGPCVAKAGLKKCWIVSVPTFRGPFQGTLTWAWEPGLVQIQEGTRDSTRLARAASEADAATVSAAAGESTDVASSSSPSSSKTSKGLGASEMRRPVEGTKPGGRRGASSQVCESENGCSAEYVRMVSVKPSPPLHCVGAASISERTSAGRSTLSRRGRRSVRECISPMSLILLVWLWEDPFMDSSGSICEASLILSVGLLGKSFGPPQPCSLPRRGQRPRISRTAQRCWTLVFFLGLHRQRLRNRTLRESHWRLILDEQAHAWCKHKSWCEPVALSRERHDGARTQREVEHTAQRAQRTTHTHTKGSTHSKSNCLVGRWTLPGVFRWRFSCLREHSEMRTTCWIGGRLGNCVVWRLIQFPRFMSFSNYLTPEELFSWTGQKTQIVPLPMCLAFAWKFSVLECEVAQKPDKLCRRSRSRNGVFNDTHSMFDVSVSGSQMWLCQHLSVPRNVIPNPCCFCFLGSNWQGSRVNSCLVCRLVDTRTSTPPGNNDLQQLTASHASIHCALEFLWTHRKRFELGFGLKRDAHVSPFMAVCKFNRLRVAPELPASWERRRLKNPTNIATIINIGNSVLGYFRRK